MSFREKLRDESMNIKIYLSFFLASLIIIGCSEIENNIPTSGAISAHGEGVLNPTSNNFHGKLVKSINWNLKECQTCHAANYSGGTTNKSCLSCHTSSKGPEACNTCHGEFADTTRIAPPQDTDGNTSASSPKVGAHSEHLFANVFGNQVKCNTCHVVPTSVFATGHLENSSNDLSFDTLASLTTNDSTSQYYNSTIGTIKPTPAYDASTGTCSSVYCHGAFKNGNTTNTVVWNAGANERKCGRCHGDVTTGNPTPKGTHLQGLTTCSCHGDVATFDGTNFSITNKLKHINGLLFIFGSEVRY